jgi:flavodoxin/ferredoxin
MKALIISFSQSGNTKKAAACIAEGIREKGDSCLVTDLESVDQNSLGDYDLVGLGCPVFFLQEPYNVRDFIEGLAPHPGKDWFVFCTHGSVMGITLHSMTKGLEKKGIRVIGSHHTYADATIPFYPYPTLTTGHPDAQDIEEAKVFGREIAACYRNIADGDTSGIKGPYPVPEDWVEGDLAMYTRDMLPNIMPPMTIDAETCTECGECEDACPVGGIDISADPRRIQEPCIYCWNCVKVCPTSSIEADFALISTLVPGFYERYTQALKAAEARGEYRWLVDYKTINLKDSLYEQSRRKTGKEDKD